jgi:hypothetical protein
MSLFSLYFFIGLEEAKGTKYRFPVFPIVWSNSPRLDPIHFSPETGSGLGMWRRSVGELLLPHVHN